MSTTTPSPNNRCAYCQAEIKAGDVHTQCPSCASQHHVQCWTENAGCATFGCANAPAPKLPPVGGKAAAWDQSSPLTDQSSASSVARRGRPRRGVLLGSGAALLLLVGGLALFNLTSGASSDVIPYPEVITKFKSISGEQLDVDSADGEWERLGLPQGNTYGTFSLYVVKNSEVLSLKSTVGTLLKEASVPDSNGVRWEHVTDGGTTPCWVALKQYHDNVVLEFFGEGTGPNSTPDPAFTRLDGLLRTL